MTRKPTQRNAKTPLPRAQPARQSITFELVTRLAPHQGLTDNLVRTFGLEPVDYDSIRDATAEHIARAAKAFGTALNEKALQIHLQRITGAFVSSAFGAAQFYGTKKSAAMELTSKLLNDDRDEDRDGPAGFESKAERARLFAAEMALQSFALMAAAEGAITAYADITGETWKPYEAPLAPSASVSRKSAAVEMAAFDLAAYAKRSGGIQSGQRLRPGPLAAGKRVALHPCRFDAAGSAPALTSSSAAARDAGVTQRRVTASDARYPARNDPGPCVRRFARRVFSLHGQGGDLPVLHVPCRDGDGQTPASPWRKPAPSIAASPQRNLTPWPLSLRDDAVQQESSPAASGIPREARFPSPFATPRGVDQRRPAVSDGLLSRSHRAASRKQRRLPMATIGTFTKKDTTYQGTITTLTLKAKVNITPVARENDKAPDFRVYAGSAEIGAAWSTTAKNGNAYLSVKLDDPSFAAAIFARLVESDGSHVLVWSR